MVDYTKKKTYKIIDRKNDDKLEDAINELAAEGYRIEHTITRSWNSTNASYPTVIMRLQDENGVWL